MEEAWPRAEGSRRPDGPSSDFFRKTFHRSLFNKVFSKKFCQEKFGEKFREGPSGRTGPRLYWLFSGAWLFSKVMVFVICVNHSPVSQPSVTSKPSAIHSHHLWGTANSRSGGCYVGRKVGVAKRGSPVTSAAASAIKNHVDDVLSPERLHCFACRL